jgi:hypothetical protein
VKTPIEKQLVSNKSYLEDSSFTYESPLTLQELRYLKDTFPVYQVEEDLPDGGRTLYTKVVDGIDSMEINTSNPNSDHHVLTAVVREDGGIGKFYVNKKSFSDIMREYRKLTQLLFICHDRRRSDIQLAKVEKKV